MNDLYSQAQDKTMARAHAGAEKWTQLTDAGVLGLPGRSAAYSLALMPASAITLAHLAMSVLMVVPSTAGVLPTVSTPI